MADSMLKVLEGISLESMECLNKDEQKKEKEENDSFYTILGREDQISTCANCLILLMRLMDSVLIKQRLLTNEYQCGTAGFSMGNHKPYCNV